MDIKERFKEAKFVKNKIERLEEARNYIVYLRGAEIQNISDTTIGNINKQIKEGKRKLYDYITELLNEMDKLDSESQYNVMFKRYIQFKGWDEIANECHYKMKWIFELRNRALEKLNNKEITL